MNEPLYNRDILRLAVSIPHQRRLENPDGTAEIRSRTCGSVVVVDVKLGPEGLIEQMGIDVNACALGQASAAIAATHAIGRGQADFVKARNQLAGFLTGEEVLPGEWEDMDKLVVAKNHPGRHPAILLSYDALIAACANAAQQGKAV